MRAVFTCIFLISAVQAQSLQSIIEHTLEQHASLKSIEKRLSVLDDAITVSQAFTNPELSFGISDIQLNNPLERSLEPMQTTSISFKQKIPYFGKRDAAQAQLEARKNVLNYTLEDAEVKLVERIKLAAYAIYKTDAQLKINDNVIRALEQSIELHNAYSSVNDTSHMQMMSAELSITQYKSKKSRLQSMRKRLYAQLRYLASSKVTNLELDNLHVNRPVALSEYEKHLEQNRGYKVKSAKLNVANKNIHVNELSSNIDPFVKVGYYYREAYEDYVNISFGAAIPIYGREASVTEASRKEALAVSFEKADYLAKMQSDLHSVYAQLQDAFTTYSIITKESLSQLEHMFELSEASIKSGANLSQYLILIEKKLFLEEQRIGAISAYHSAKASIAALLGERQ